MFRYLVSIFATILSATIICSVLASGIEKFSSKYDDIDVEAILNTPRLREQYVKCYLRHGPCATPESRFFKEILPEALVTKCFRCTEKQKIFLEKIVIWFEENDKETWNLILSAAIDEHLNKKKS